MRLPLEFRFEFGDQLGQVGAGGWLVHAGRRCKLSSNFLLFYPLLRDTIDSYQSKNAVSLQPLVSLRVESSISPFTRWE